MQSVTRTVARSAKRGYSTKSFLDAHNPFSVTTYSRPDIVIRQGRGSYLWDTEGKKYVDFTAGIAVTGLGHCDDQVAEIIADQSKTLIHASNLYYNEWTPRLQKAIVETTLNAGGMHNASRVFLANSGSEANEAALKFARKHGNNISKEKTEIVSFNRSFHGRTMGALTVTANPKYTDPFRPLIPGVKHGNINDIEAIDSLVTDKTCAVIVEPIQSEGGIYVCDADFLVALKKRCSQVGALLIYDEIQCGLGRTGKLWAHQWLPKEAHPDILSLAKAIGNGYPIGATLVTEEVEKALKVGDHGTTYGGNPLGCRVAHHVLSRLASPEIQQNVETVSQLFKNRFQKLQQKFPDTITEIRGKGLLLGLQLSKDPTPILDKARDAGLLVITCGVNTIRFVPALNIPAEVAKEGLDILESVFE